MRTCISVEKKKKCLSVAIGNKLNSLIQITSEFYLKELSQDIDCIKNKYIRKIYTKEIVQMLKIQNVPGS